MKAILLIAFTCTFALFATAQNAAVKFAKEEHDFGTIKQNVPVTYDFTFTNTSNAPIVIESATASCGCTTPTWPQTPIMPGKTNVIKAGFNAASPAPFTKDITVKIQGVELPVILKIKGTVVAATQATATTKPAATSTTVAIEKKSTKKVKKVTKAH